MSPLWDYRCRKCKHVLRDIVIDIDEEPPQCPHCGALTKKLYTKAPYAKYVGEGFYATSPGGTQVWNELKGVGSSESEQAWADEAYVKDDEDWKKGPC